MSVENTGTDKKVLAFPNEQSDSENNNRKLFSAEY